VKFIHLFISVAVLSSDAPTVVYSIDVAILTLPTPRDLISVSSFLYGAVASTSLSLLPVLPVRGLAGSVLSGRKDMTRNNGAPEQLQGFYLVYPTGRLEIHRIPPSKWSNSFVHMIRRQSRQDKKCQQPVTILTVQLLPNFSLLPPTIKTGFGLFNKLTHLLLRTSLPLPFLSFLSSSHHIPCRCISLLPSATLPNLPHPRWIRSFYIPGHCMTILSDYGRNHGGWQKKRLEPGLKAKHGLQ
jgi:hypothetical protein